MKRLLLALALSASLSAQQPVAVYVTSAGASSGFTDPSKENRDIVKDLKNSFKKTKEVRLVESADEAQIVLTVQGYVYGATHRSQFGVVTEDVKTRVRFQAGTVDMEFLEYWAQAAGKIAKQVRDWIAANRATLEARKDER